MKFPNDPILLELIPELIETWIDDINSNFDKYFESRDEQEMYRMAHTIKGSCAQFDLGDISEVGVEMLQLVKNNDWDAIYIYKKRLLDMFDEANEILKRLNNNHE